MGSAGGSAQGARARRGWGIPPAGGREGGEPPTGGGSADLASRRFWRAFCPLFNIIGHYGTTPEGEPSAGAPAEPGRGGTIMLIMSK